MVLISELLHKNSPSHDLLDDLTRYWGTVVSRNTSPVSNFQPIFDAHILQLAARGSAIKMNTQIRHVDEKEQMWHEKRLSYGKDTRITMAYVDMSNYCDG
jgi:hypothetical protein